jgi:DNA polymerase-1
MTKVIKMKHNMQTALQREVNLIPVVIDMESKGIPLHPEINAIRHHWQTIYDGRENELLAYSGGIPIGTKKAAQAFMDKGYVDMNKLTYTKTGKVSFARDNLEAMIADENLRMLLENRSRLQKQLTSYMNPWAEAYKKYGRFYPYFLQTRGDEEGGTRTGRFSSNFQQIPRERPEGEWLYLRTLIYPEDGHVLLKRDYSGQEMRIAAHYAEGSLLKAYQKDPNLDVHTFILNIILSLVDAPVNRTLVKGVNFLKLYGGGPAKLATILGITVELAKVCFEAYDLAIPEFKEMNKDIEQLARSGKPIRTWGGRKYYLQEPYMFEGRLRECYYKLVNVLIQSSAADMSKEAMVRYHFHPDRKGRILLVAHDEIVLTCPEERAKEEMALLQWAMDDIPGWDCPLLSDGKIGPNFGDVKVWDDQQHCVKEAAV